MTFFEKINFNETFAKKETLDKSVFYNPIKRVADFVYPSLKKGYESLKKANADESAEKE
jgi:membrane protein required for colicin V production